MGLKDLKKRPLGKAVTDEEHKALEFINGAPLSSTSEAVAGASHITKASGYKRTTFSLTDELNEQIDRLSLTSRTFRVSRSDVVRAGVIALMAMPDEELLSILAKACKTELLKFLT